MLVEAVGILVEAVGILVEAAGILVKAVTILLKAVRTSILALRISTVCKKETVVFVSCSCSETADLLTRTAWSLVETAAAALVK